MKTSTTPRNPPRHVVQWVREQLAINQLQFSEATQVGLFSLQSIESGRLKLSERFAYRLAKATGIQPQWFLANELVEPLPDRAELKKHFEHAQKSGIDLYPGRLLPRMISLSIRLPAKRARQKTSRTCGLSPFRSPGSLGENEPEAPHYHQERQGASRVL